MTRAVGFFAIIAIILAMAFGFSYLAGDSDSEASPEASLRSMTVDGVPIRVTVADSVEERMRGLSGREGLALDEGMLFVFPEDGRHSFWMKDMRFSIDILWISRAGEVIHVERNVSPESYPKPFTSDSPARYVLEVPAGFAEQHGIGVGSKTQVP